jgi:hypothetical protein
MRLNFCEGFTVDSKSVPLSSDAAERLCSSPCVLTQSARSWRLHFPRPGGNRSPLKRVWCFRGSHSRTTPAAWAHMSRHPLPPRHGGSDLREAGGRAKLRSSERAQPDAANGTWRSSPHWESSRTGRRSGGSGSRFGLAIRPQPTK